MLSVEDSRPIRFLPSISENRMTNSDTLSAARQRIAELEDQLRQVQKGSLDKWQLEKSRAGNIYWDYDSETQAKERPYEGSDNQFVSIFASDNYRQFIADHPELQEYWRSPMYCIDRKPDGYKEVCSNIHRGDYFGCGDTRQVGHIYAKITNIQCSLKPEYRKPSPLKDESVYLSYWIGGDIGGHWHKPTHDDFTATNHFIWLPTIERLIFAGFHRQAGYLAAMHAALS